MSFIFYDTETTGLDSAFDQILQFAAVRTDPDLNEIERFEIRSRLLPHIIPSPDAVKITGVTVDQLTDPSLPSHYEMICAIRSKLIEWSPAIFVGHNSIEFDEHFVRQALFQTLHPPYLTNTNKNCRLDSLRIIQTVSLLAPDAIKFPIDDKGRKKFKLEQLAPTNGFGQMNAHDALGDVEAMIHMCKLLSERVPEIWSHFVRFSQKAAVLDYVLDEPVFSLSDFYFGKPYSWIVALIGKHPERSSEVFALDLRFDPDKLAALDDGALAKLLRGSPKPIRRIRANACPAVFPKEDAPDIAEAHKLSNEEIEIRATRIKNDQLLSDRLIQTYLSTQKVKEQSPHVEKQMYDKFSSDEDLRIMAEFHEAEWSERHTMLSSFEDERLRILGERLIYLENPDQLPGSVRRDCDLAMARRILGSDRSAPWLTLPQAIQQTDDLIQVSEGDAVGLLTNLHSYLTDRVEEAAKFLV